jgi:hypothetical protein
MTDVSLIIAGAHNSRNLICKNHDSSILHHCRSASFKTPQHVRREWAEVNGLSDFTSERYDRAMDAVCKRLNVNTGNSSLPPFES